MNNAYKFEVILQIFKICRVQIFKVQIFKVCKVQIFMVQIFKVCKVQIFTIFMEQILPACMVKIGSSTIV